MTLKIEKLELKHLACYLPYGLKIYSQAHNNLGNPYPEMNATGGTYYEGINQVVQYQLKPLLLPLSELNKEVNYGLQSYKFIDIFEIGDDAGFEYDFDSNNTKLIKQLDTIAKHNLY